MSKLDIPVELKYAAVKTEFESWKDPEGGEWIRITSGNYDGVIWRPVAISISDDNENKINYTVEFFTGPGIKVPSKLDTFFEPTAGAIVKEIMMEMIRQDGDKL